MPSSDHDTSPESQPPARTYAPSNGSSSQASASRNSPAQNATLPWCPPLNKVQLAPSLDWYQLPGSVCVTNIPSPNARLREASVLIAPPSCQSMPSSDHAL